MASFDVSDRLENHRHVGTRRSMTLRDSLCDATNRKWCEFPGPYHNGDAASVQSSATGTQNSSICHKSSLHTAHSRASGSRHYGFSAFRKYAWVLAATVNLSVLQSYAAVKHSILILHQSSDSITRLPSSPLRPRSDTFKRPSTHPCHMGSTRFTTARASQKVVSGLYPSNHYTHRLSFAQRLPATSASIRCPERGLHES